MSTTGQRNGTSALISSKEIRKAYVALTEPGQIIEIRALKAADQPHARYTETLGGYFDNVEDLLREVARLHTAMGIYLTLQPVDPRLLHRAKNKLIRQERGDSTSDKHIMCYRWLLIDSDPDRVTNISSTDQEHALALAHSRQIRDTLRLEGWPDPIEGDSGNGAHLLYRIDLEASEYHLVKRVLEGLAFRFDTSEVQIDQTVYNPARICKLYGTLACKGDHTQERPHRLSRLLHQPSGVQVVGRELLEALASPVLPPKESVPAKKQRTKSPFNLEDWLKEHQIETYEPTPYEGGTRYILKQCTWDPSHTDKSAVLIQFENGAISASCRHNGCAGKKWEDFRVLFEPDAYKPRSSPDSGSERGSDLALQLVELARSSCELFTTPKGERYARVQVRDHRESLLLEGKSFQRWLLHHFVNSYGSVPNKTALESAIDVLEGQAQFGDVESREVYLRLAPYQDDRIYLDLGNSAYEVVEITASGWRILSDPPVCFRRAQGTLPLPRPETGGSLQELRPFLNVDDEDWILVQAWLLGTFHPRGPYAILALSGEHGSAKSTTTRLLRSLIDPSKAPLRKEPKDDQAFAIMAHNNYIVAMDNLSHLSARLSDNMCTLSTGAGDAFRKLYYNDEETLFEDCHPQIFNGIEELATRGDLIDRCLAVKLLTMEEGQRQDEKAYWAAFEAAKPRILGALLDAVSLALRNLSSTTIKNLPRMADFSLWVQAAESAITSKPGSFLQSYRKNRSEGTVGEIDSSPVGRAVLALLQEVPVWTSTATELKKKLEEIVGEGIARKKTWPGDARVLSNVLKRLAPSLREQQIQVEMGYKGRSRYITLSTTTSTLLTEHPQQETEDGTSETATLDSLERNANNATATLEFQRSVAPAIGPTGQPGEGATLATQDFPNKKVFEQHQERENEDLPETSLAIMARQPTPHQADESLFAHDLGWCEWTEPHRSWMYLGRSIQYPQIEIPIYGLKVNAGLSAWLQFAREVEYPLVQQALEEAMRRLRIE